MALKFKYPSQDDVPEEHRGLYIERDGAFVLDAEGAVDKGKVDEFRTNNVALKRQLDSLTARYEGIDPDAVKRLLAEKAKLEEEKLLQDGEVEKLVEKRTRAALADVEKRLHSAEQQAATLSAQLLEKEIERHVVESATKLGLRPSAIPDIKARSRSVFQVVGGAVAAVEADGRTPLVGADGATPLTFEEWVTRQVAEAPHLFESNAGGGAVGNGSGGVGTRSGRNPFRRGPDWNLTEQMRVQRTDPKLAERLRAAA